MRTGKPIFFLMLMLALSNPMPGMASAAPTTAVSARDREAQLLGELGGARVSRHGETGKVRFVGASGTRPVKSAASLNASASPESAARAFLGRYGSLFGVDDAASELRTVRVQKADRGRSSVRFQQVHQGVPVLAGEMMVNLDAQENVLSANGEVTQVPGLRVLPAVTANSARQAAIGKVAKQYRVRARTLSVGRPELWIYDPALLGGSGLRGPVLVWRMDVFAGDLGDVREFVLVDALKGVVALNFNQVPHAKQRYICDRDNVVGAPEACASGYARSEGQPARGIADVDLAYDYSGITYNFFRSRFGRDSLDNKGMALRSTVRYCPDAATCPFQNAYWNGKQMVYGSGYAAADDVVGHELSHGVTDFTSHLFYYYQSGAINESLSDVFGELIDLTDARGDDAASKRWEMGEDLPDDAMACFADGAIRSMKDPTLCGDPDRITSAKYKSGWEDQGGVHSNSGVNNKAAYLMTDGGTFNGRTITALGVTRTAVIYYEVEANLLTSGSDYNDLYDMLQQACNNLIGVSDITAANCADVRDAVLATEMNKQPTSGVTRLEAVMCPSGQLPADLFSDNLENTASGNWVKSRARGSSNWAYPQNPNVYPGYDASYATSGRYNFWGNNPGGTSGDATSDFSIAKGTGIAIPTGRTTYLRFDHAFSFEQGYDYFGDETGVYYDGGVVEYTVNGTTWRDADALFTDSGYRGSISTSDTNPLKGRRAFVGESGGYHSSRVNLSSLAGQTVRFRFRIGTDARYGDYGWFVDDIRVYTCGSRTAPTTTNLLENPGFEHDDNNDSHPDAWSRNTSALRMPTVRRTGSYAIRHRAADNEVYAVSQIVTGPTAGRAYTASAYVNIPTTSSPVSFTYEVQFRNSSGGVIQTRTIKTYADDTAGAWNLASLRVTAPTGTTSARVRMVQRALGATVYADDLVFRP